MSPRRLRTAVALAAAIGGGFLLGARAAAVPGAEAGDRAPAAAPPEGKAADSSPAPLFAWREGPDGKAAIRIDPGRAGSPISRRLFGKFTEHLHRNIYHGMWAQVARNPGFEDWRFFFSTDAGLERERARAAASGRPWPDGLAAHWLAEGDGRVVLSLDRDRVNSETSQRVAIESPGSGAAGIRQEEVFLPLHRESEYLASVSLRARGVTEVTLSLRDGGRTLASARLGGLLDTWRRHHARLRVREQVARGAPLTLALTADRPGEFLVDQLLIFPADAIHGFDRDVVELCRRARLSLLRYPGGNFASGYHWEDGVGPPDRRPMRRNPAWDCPEYNHVGTDEFMAFCEAVGRPLPAP
jgi:alpha-N-arabinofuranosidase